jgi:hypothetical protein
VSARWSSANRKMMFGFSIANAGVVSIKPTKAE